MNLPEKQKVICYGEALWDVFPDGSVPGGAPMNVAIHLNNLGVDVELVSKVGDDTAGKELLKFISRNQLSTKYIFSDSGHPTGKVNVSLDEQGNATYEICKPAAWDYIEMTPDIEKLSSKAGIIIYGTLSSRSLHSRTTLNTLLKSNSMKVIDVNFRPPYNDREIIEPLLHSADIIKLNDDELKEIASWYGFSLSDNQAIKWLSKFYDCSLVLLTLGEWGAMVYSAGKIHKHGGYKIKAIDTVGSGDSFLAAFIASLTGKQSVDKALDFACATGSFVATKKGATPEISRDEIESFKYTAC